MSFRIHFFTDCLRSLSIVVNLFRSRFPGVFSSPEKAKRRTHPTNRRQSFRGESFSLVETPSTSVSRTTICYSVLTFPGGWALENSTTIRGLRRGVGQARALARTTRALKVRRHVFFNLPRSPLALAEFSLAFADRTSPPPASEDEDERGEDADRSSPHDPPPPTLPLRPSRAQTSPSPSGSSL